MIADDMALSRAMAGAIDAARGTGADDASAEHHHVPLCARGPALLARRASASKNISNDLNTALLDALQRGGELFVSNAVIRGRYALRACIVNFHTSAADVEALPGIVVAQGRTLDARLRTNPE